MTQQRSTIVVFSNLESIVHGSTRLSAHAAVLQNSPSLLDGESPRWQLLGFLHDDSVQTFALDVPGAKFDAGDRRFTARPARERSAELWALITIAGGQTEIE